MYSNLIKNLDFSLVCSDVHNSKLERHDPKGKDVIKTEALFELWKRIHIYSL